MFTLKKAVALVAGVAAGALVFAAVAAPAPAQAQTTAELQAQIQALLAQIQALQGSASGSATANYTFTRDLTIGSTGADVTALQKFLMSKGNAIAAGATGYFGLQTKAALMAYQSANGIVPAAGYFGPITRAKVGASVVVTPGDDDDTSDDDDDNDNDSLDGGAGSVSEYQLMSGLNNEEVGEDSEDVQVAGLEIEADEGSDLRFTAVRLVFDEGTAASDFEDYASEVSIWFDGEEVGRVDADEFNDDNVWTKTISLESGAVVDAGETAELVVAVSGISNLDTNDQADTWTVDFRSVRFVDGQGASTSEDPTTATRTFSFESFASAADTQLKITEDDDSINDARVIDVHASDDTDNVSLLSFTLEAEGDSDLTIQKFAASTTVTGAANVDDLINKISLWIDGKEVASGSAYQDADGATVGATEDYLFDDLDYTIAAGETVEAEIRADFNSVADALDEADTIQVDIKEDITDQVALFDIEDESGEELVDGDISGSATGGAHSVYDSSVNAEFVSATATNDDASNANTNLEDDTGTFIVKFDVTAFGADVYIDGDLIASSAATVIVDNTASGGTIWGTTTNSTNGIGTTTTQATLEAAGTETGDVETAGALSFKVPEDQTRQFTMTIKIPAGTDAVAGVRLRGINWDTDSGDAHANLYTFDLGDYKTPVIVLDADA